MDYSAYNEEGLSHSSEAGVINVDNLSTWKTTPDDLNVPDKPLPYKEICTIPSGKYEVVLTNEGGGYSAPYPIINVREISEPKKPKSLINNLSLEKSFEYSNYEIVFSPAYPSGNIVSEKLPDD